MASLRCHSDSDCNKTQIIRIFHLYIIQLWKPFFHIFTHNDVVNAQTWEAFPPKKSSRATLNAYYSESVHQELKLVTALLRWNLSLMLIETNLQ